MSIKPASCLPSVPIITFLPIFLVIFHLITRCQANCEKNFDAILCNRHSNGYGFRNGSVWTLECNMDEIYVLEHSKKDVNLHLSAAFTDNEFTYLFQSREVWIMQGLNLDTMKGPYFVSDLFNGFTGPVEAAFFAANNAYLMNGQDFHVYTQKVFTKDKLPAWLYSSQHDTDLRFGHPKLRNIQSAMTMVANVKANTVRSGFGPDSRTVTQLVLIIDETSCYKLDFERCLRKVGHRLEVNDACLAGRPYKTEYLFRCTWFTWTALVAVSGLVLLFILLVAYCIILFICYKRHRDTGTFRHEKQTCCRPEGHYFGIDQVHPNDEAIFHFMETESETTTIASAYNEDKPSIDLNEAHYGKYGTRY
ncbi:hypothetical protein HDE_07228 [Halotydeus destructor]|nr:hypothetical protein HDE_07228 [Halotydeus destructor]